MKKLKQVTKAVREGWKEVQVQMKEELGDSPSKKETDGYVGVLVKNITKTEHWAGKNKPGERAIRLQITVHPEAYRYKEENAAGALLKKHLTTAMDC